MKEWELNDKTYCCLISEIKKIRSFDDEEKYIENNPFKQIADHIFLLDKFLASNNLNFNLVACI